MFVDLRALYPDTLNYIPLMAICRGRLHKKYKKVTFIIIFAYILVPLSLRFSPFKRYWFRWYMIWSSCNSFLFFFLTKMSSMLNYMYTIIWCAFDGYHALLFISYFYHSSFHVTCIISQVTHCNLYGQIFRIYTLVIVSISAIINSFGYISEISKISHCKQDETCVYILYRPYCKV